MKLRRKKKRVEPLPIPDVQMSPTLDGSRFPPSIFNPQEHLKTRLRVRDIMVYEKITGRPARDTSTYGTLRRRISKVHSEIRELNFQKKQVANIVKDRIIYDIELKVEELLKLNRLRDRVQKHIVKVARAQGCDKADGEEKPQLSELQCLCGLYGRHSYSCVYQETF